MIPAANSARPACLPVPITSQTVYALHGMHDPHMPPRVRGKRAHLLDASASGGNYSGITSYTTSPKWRAAVQFTASSHYLLMNSGFTLEDKVLYEGTWLEPVAPNWGIDLWFRAASFVSSSNDVIVCCRDTDNLNYSSPGQIYWSLITGSTGKLSLQFSEIAQAGSVSTGTMRTVETAASTVSTGTWYHVRFVKFCSHILLYLDGTFVGMMKQPTVSPGTRNKLIFGGSDSYSSYPFLGAIEDFRIVSSVGALSVGPNCKVPTEAFRYEEKIVGYGSISGATMSGGDRQVSQTASATEGRALSRNFLPKTGKWYWEMYFTDPGVLTMASGMVKWSAGTAFYCASRSNANTAFVDASLTRATQVSWGVSTGVLMIAYDADAGKMWVGRDGSWFSSGSPSTDSNPYYSDIPAGDWELFWHADNDNNGGGTGLIRTGTGNQSYSAPSGFTALVTNPTAKTGDALLLMHMDGTNGSTTFTDSSRHVRTVTPSGNAQISTAQSKFGGASALFDGTGDYLSVTYSAAFADLFREGNWVVECFVRTTTVAAGVAVIFTMRGSNATYAPILLGRNGSALILFVSKDGAAWHFTRTTGGVLSANTWYHVAAVRYGHTISLYLDGVNLSNDTVSGELYDEADNFIIGGDSNANYWNGYIDELSVWAYGLNEPHYLTGGFTVPTAAYDNPT